MHANDMLEYEDQIIEASRDGTFSSEHLKKNQMMLLMIMC